MRIGNWNGIVRRERERSRSSVMWDYDRTRLSTRLIAHHTTQCTVITVMYVFMVCADGLSLLSRPILDSYWSEIRIQISRCEREDIKIRGSSYPHILIVFLVIHEFMNSLMSDDIIIYELRITNYAWRVTRDLVTFVWTFEWSYIFILSSIDHLVISQSCNVTSRVRFRGSRELASTCITWLARNFVVRHTVHSDGR